MNCVICKTGTTKHSKTNSLFERNGCFVIVKDIPAEVCSQCGEAYFDEATTRDIQNRVNEALKNGAELEVLSLKAA